MLWMIILKMKMIWTIKENNILQTITSMSTEKHIHIVFNLNTKSCLQRKSSILLVHNMSWILHIIRRRRQGWRKRSRRWRKKKKKIADRARKRRLADKQTAKDRGTLIFLWRHRPLFAALNEKENRREGTRTHPISPSSVHSTPRLIMATCGKYTCA